MKKAIVLCSGGIDSVVAAYWAQSQYDSISLLFFNYGQAGVNYELDCARFHAQNLGCSLEIVNLSIQSNSIIHTKRAFNKVQKKDLRDTSKISKQWYVPSRNLLFITHAFSIAEGRRIVDKADYDIILGLGAEGSDSYPDATSRFIVNLNRLAENLYEGSISVKAPLIKKNKEDIIALGNKFGVDLAETRSCYGFSRKHCGTCLACALRKHGFYWANLEDPTLYNA